MYKSDRRGIVLTGKKFGKKIYIWYKKYILRYDKEDESSKQFIFHVCLTCISCFPQKGSYARKKIWSVKIAMYIHIKENKKKRCTIYY